MKRIYLFLIGMLSIGIANAQYNVTFQVNMSNEIVTDLGAHVAGNWQDQDGGGSEWTPGDSPMVDNGDGTWSLTVSIPAGTYEYKFLRSDFWNDGNGTDYGENPFNACGSNTNRSFTVVDADVVLPLYCFNRCVPCGNNGLRVAVAEAPSTGIYVGGDYTDPLFEIFTALNDYDGNDIYDGVIAVPEFYDTVQYRFSDGNNPDGSGYEFPDGTCINLDGNRSFVFPSDGDFSVLPVVWGTCENLAVQVTARVDMTNYETCYGQLTAEDTVNLTGPLGDGWGSTTIMTDPENDGIYEVVISKSPGDYEYKFRIDGNYEGGSNRAAAIVAGNPIVLSVFCYGSAEGVCVPNFAPANVTFEATPGVEVIPSGQKMWIFGDFTSYQGGALAMADTDADGVWTATANGLCNNELLYKFAIGLDNTNTAENWLEENADFSEIGGCGINNDGFSDNRKLTRTNAEPIIVCYTFNSCEGCATSLNENTLTNTINIAPNPFSTRTLISVENKNGVALSMNVIDITGKEIKALTNLVNNTITIDSKGMSSGIYFLQVFNDNGQKAVKKLIVQ
jgi:Secretion system C-terminal sorting domain